MWTRLTDSSDVQACWKMANYVAGTKLGMNDHGRTHAYVATASALTMLDLLDGSLFCPDIVTGGFGDQDDATLVVMTAMLCHDLGNTIHREEHANLGVSVTLPILDGSCQKFMMTRQSSSQSGHSFSQHILTSRNTRPLTIEAALVCIADSTDMTKGRGRVAFDSGSITIHSVSALSIEKVEIKKGTTKPIGLVIHMSSPGRDISGSRDPRT